MGLLGVNLDSVAAAGAPFATASSSLRRRASFQTSREATSHTRRTHSTRRAIRESRTYDRRRTAQPFSTRTRSASASNQRPLASKINQLQMLSHHGVRTVERERAAVYRAHRPVRVRVHAEQMAMSADRVRTRSAR